MTQLFDITIRDSLGNVRETVSAGVVGVSDFRRSTTAQGKIVGLWDGTGMDTGGIGGDWRESRKRMFASQGAATGGLWPDYTRHERTYAAIKSSILGYRVSRRTADLLRWDKGRKERLYPSMTQRTHGNYVQREEPMRIRLGTTAPGADNHDKGVGTAPPHLGGGRIARRPITQLGVWFQRQVRLQVVEFAAQHTSAIGTEINRADVVRTRGGRA